MNSGAVCDRERDVLDAIAAHRWPDRLDAELSAHVRECACCSDLGTVAQTISEDYESALAQVRLPSPGLVWWRAEIRVRQESRRAASRPITIVQAIAALCGAVLALILWVWSGASSESWTVLAQHAFILPLLYTALGAAAIILGSVALYLVLSDD
jgi:hypothetical protein